MKKGLASILILALLMTGILTGCGGDTSTGENGTVYIYCFGDYIDTALISDFESETGYKVVLDTFDTNEEMYPVIKNNTVQYDVICVSDYMVEKLCEEDLLAEINFDNIPNIEYLMDSMDQVVDAFDPGMLHCVPHTYGTYGIIYNTEMVDSADMTSWNVLWDEKYQDQIIMPNSIREAYMVAAEILGYSINTTSEEEISAMTDLLIEQKGLLYEYDNDGARDTMIGGSAGIAVINSGDVLYAQGYNEDLEFFIPPEGTEIWTDCWAITNTSENKEGAEAWINFMLTKEAAEANFEYLTYAIPNTQIAELLDNPVLSPSEEILANSETLKNLGSEADSLYSTYWKKLMSN